MKSEETEDWHTAQSDQTDHQPSKLGETSGTGQESPEASQSRQTSEDPGLSPPTESSDISSEFPEAEIHCQTQQGVQRFRAFQNHRQAASSIGSNRRTEDHTVFSVGIFDIPTFLGASQCNRPHAS